MITKEDLLKKCLTQTSTFKSLVVDAEVTIRQLTIAETERYNEIRLDFDKKQSDSMNYAVSCSMVEPTFFTDEELASLGKTGSAFIYEVFSQMPYIGMTEKEKKEYDKRLKELLKDDVKKDSEDSEEDVEKK